MIFELEILAARGAEIVLTFLLFEIERCNKKQKIQKNRRFNSVKSDFRNLMAKWVRRGK